MTETASSIPAASADKDRPPEASPPHAERSPEAEAWRRARQDYLGGDSAPVVAERYRLSERTVRRRASIEGWRKADVTPPPLDDAPPWGVRLHRDQIDIIGEHPEYEEIAAARHHDTYNLLFSPEPDDLKGFAFRRACEAAAMRAMRGPAPEPEAASETGDDRVAGLAGLAGCFSSGLLTLRAEPGRDGVPVTTAPCPPPPTGAHSLR